MVEAALPAAAPVQRNGHQQIRACDFLSDQFASQHVGQRATGGEVAIELELLHQRGDRAAVAETGPGGVELRRPGQATAAARRPPGQFERALLAAAMQARKSGVAARAACRMARAVQPADRTQRWPWQVQQSFGGAAQAAPADSRPGSGGGAGWWRCGHGIMVT